MLYRSQDQGNAWDRFDAGLPAGAVPRDILSQDGELWLATDTKGVFFLPEGASEWQLRSKGLPNDVFATSLAVSGKTVALGTYQHGVFVSHNGGLNWNHPIINLRNNPVLSLQFMDGVIIAGTDRGFFRSYDGGLGWLGKKDDYLTVQDLVKHKGKLLAARRDGILVSEDAGLTWTNIRKSVSIYDFMLKGESLYAFGSSTRLRSKDGGTTWEASPETNTGSRTTSLPEALWHGQKIVLPDDRMMRKVYDTERGWLVGVGAGC